MSDNPSSASSGSLPETFNPWSVVNLVFHHLADQGLHPVLGATGDPGGPAADLLRALGVAPTVEGNRQIKDDVHEQLTELRAAFAAAAEPEKPEPGSTTKASFSR
jgi:hypothetical protein